MWFHYGLMESFWFYAPRGYRINPLQYDLSATMPNNYLEKTRQKLLAFLAEKRLKGIEGSTPKGFEYTVWTEGEKIMMRIGR